MRSLNRIRLPAREFDLAATLDSGQAFRWRPQGEFWEGVVGTRWVRLRAVKAGIEAATPGRAGDWTWLESYLQTRTDLNEVLAAFPADGPMLAAVRACRGLRLLRQDPWECLASFICSSTKQIVQIREIIDRLCARFGEPVEVPGHHAPAYAFPSPSRLGAAPESELRECRMGFRAPYLREAARRVVTGDLSLTDLEACATPRARERLTALPGVGPKIADCVLLFAYGRQDAFPMDVWVRKALQELYFPDRRATLAELQRFSREHFGPFAGYAQQYLFHYIRVHSRPRNRQDRRPT